MAENISSVDLEMMSQARMSFEALHADNEKDRINVITTNEALQTGWHGNAAITFDNAMNEWDAQCGIVQQALLNIVETLIDSGAIYGNAEDQQVNDLLGLANML